MQRVSSVTPSSSTLRSQVIQPGQSFDNTFNLSFDDFVSISQDDQLTIDYKGLDSYLHSKALEYNIDYKDFLNILLEYNEYSTYILYLLIDKYHLNQDEDSKVKIFIKLIGEGYNNINNILNIEPSNFINYNNYCNYYAETPLTAAAVSNDTQVFHNILQASFQLANTTNKDNLTPLMVAAKNGNSDITRILLKETFFGLNVNIVNKLGNTALMLAIIEGHTFIVKQLLDIAKERINFASNIDSSNINRETPIILAAQKGNTDIIQLLLNYKLSNNNQSFSNDNNTVFNIYQANIDLDDINGDTALIHATRLGYTSIVTQLLDTRLVNVNHFNKVGDTPFIIAARQGYNDIISLLLDTNLVNVNQFNKIGDTALTVAAREGNSDIVEMLISIEEVNINHINYRNRSALLLALSEGHIDIVNILLDVDDINVNIRHNFTQTAIEVAAAKGYVDIVNKLLAYDKIESIVLQMALLSAAQYGHSDVVRLFLNSDKIESRTLQMALMSAAQYGNIDVIKELVKYGVDLNQIDDLGNTALMVAIKEGHIDIVNQLIEYGVDLNQIDDLGNTALMVAIKEGHIDVVNQLIAQYGTDLNQVNNQDKNALMLAAEEGYIDVVRLLQNYAKDHNFVISIFSSRKTAVNLAAKRGHWNIVRLLLNDTINHLRENNRLHIFKDRYSMDLLKRAIKNRQNDIVQQLITEELVNDDQFIDLLEIAIESNNIEAAEIIEQYLDQADIRIDILEAARKGYFNIILRYLDDVDVNIADKYGKTVLIYAAEKCQFTLIRLSVESKEIDQENLLQALDSTKNCSLIQKRRIRNLLTNYLNE